MAPPEARRSKNCLLGYPQGTQPGGYLAVRETVLGRLTCRIVSE